MSVWRRARTLYVIRRISVMALPRPALRLLLLMAPLVAIPLAAPEAGAATLRPVSKYAPLVRALEEERRQIVGASLAMETLVSRAVIAPMPCRTVMARVTAAIAVPLGRLHVLERFVFLTRCPW